MTLDERIYRKGTKDRYSGGVKLEERAIALCAHGAGARGSDQAVPSCDLMRTGYFHESLERRVGRQRSDKSFNVKEHSGCC